MYLQSYLLFSFCFSDRLSLFPYSEAKEEEQAVLHSAEEFKKQIEEAVVFK